MKFYPFIIRKWEDLLSQIYCLWTLLVISIVLFFFQFMVRPYSMMVSQAILFAWGLLSWTLLEYVSHRYWMHSKAGEHAKRDFANHRYHHTHPTDLKLSGYHRILLLMKLAGLMVISFHLHNYLTLVTGFLAGFVLYTFMHVILHQKWSARIFKKLNEYHIYHHCKYPNRCFGVTVTWWDRFFGTTPPPGARVTDRITHFYFNGRQSEPKHEMPETTSENSLKNEENNHSIKITDFF